MFLLVELIIPLIIETWKIILKHKLETGTSGQASSASAPSIYGEILHLVSKITMVILAGFVGYLIQTTLNNSGYPTLLTLRYDSDLAVPQALLIFITLLFIVRDRAIIRAFFLLLLSSAAYSIVAILFPPMLLEASPEIDYLDREFNSIVYVHLISLFSLIIRAIIRS